MPSKKTNASDGAFPGDCRGLGLACVMTGGSGRLRSEIFRRIRSARHEFSSARVAGAGVRNSNAIRLTVRIRISERDSIKARR